MVGKDIGNGTVEGVDDGIAKEKMNSDQLDDMKINVKFKLAALWITVNLLYLYVDIYSFYRPGIIEGAIAGEVGDFQITQGFLLGVIILQIIASLMVFLCLVLKPKVNRWTNIGVGIFSIVYVLGNAVGDAWAYYVIASIVELLLLSLIIWYAWKWPTLEGGSARTEN